MYRGTSKRSKKSDCDQLIRRSLKNGTISRLNSLVYKEFLGGCGADYGFSTSFAFMITRHRLHGRNVYSWPVTKPELLVQGTKPHENAGENGKPTFCWFLKVNTCRIGRLGTLCCDIPGTWRGMNHQGLGRYSRGRILANQLLLCRLHGCDRPSSRGSTTIDQAMLSCLPAHAPDLR